MNGWLINELRGRGICEPQRSEFDMCKIITLLDDIKWENTVYIMSWNVFMVNITSQSAITKVSASMDTKLALINSLLMCNESNHIMNHMDISRL